MQAETFDSTYEFAPIAPPTIALDDPRTIEEVKKYREECLPALKLAISTADFGELLNENPTSLFTLTGTTTLTIDSHFIPDPIMDVPTVMASLPDCLKVFENDDDDHYKAHYINRILHSYSCMARMRVAIKIIFKANMDIVGFVIRQVTDIPFVSRMSVEEFTTQLQPYQWADILVNRIALGKGQVSKINKQIEAFLNSDVVDNGFRRLKLSWTLTDTTVSNITIEESVDLPQEYAFKQVQSINKFPGSFCQSASYIHGVPIGCYIAVNKTDEFMMYNTIRVIGSEQPPAI